MIFGPRMLRFRGFVSDEWRRISLSLTLVLALPVLASAAGGFSGLSLIDALERLRHEGLSIIFSDALVKPTMTVETEPEAGEPRAVLDEILEPHGLGVREGSGGQLVVVPQTVDYEDDAESVPEGPIRLSSDLIFLNEIVVTPSYFRIEQLQPDNRVFLSREDVKMLPHVGDDIYRAVKRLPGTAAGDYSATFNVRGGEQGELLVLLDGFELLEPFHLKDFQNVFSTVDSESVGGLDFLTGGFPAEYGDRMSGVMDISTLVPEGPTLTSITVGTLNTRVASEGRFDEGRGSWLINARAWYPVAIFDLAVGTADEVLVDYYDLLAKVDHEIGSHSILSGNVLASYDDLGFTTEDVEEVETVAARYSSGQMWLNLKTNWTENLFSQTVASYARARRHRVGGYIDLVEGSLDIDDERDLDYAGFKQDWTLQVGDRHYLKWGYDIRRQHALYDYSRIEVILDPEDDDAPPERLETTVDLDLGGSSNSAYIADRFRISDVFVAELGLRWDRQFYIGDHQLSPRVNLMVMLSPKSTVRLAWGRFYQSQRLNELQVEDGVTEFYPAQLANHFLASFEHLFESGYSLRLEAYEKRLSDLRPRYENIFNPLELFPEAAVDRVLIAPDAGRSRGIEALVRSDSTKSLTWWAGYALAWSEDEIEGDMVPRSWDQRHAVNLGFSWQLPKGWALNLAGTYHSGWPTTPVTAEWVIDDDGEEIPEFVVGSRNTARYPEYHRLDVRASKSFTLSRGELRLILEVLNLTNRENVCCTDDFHAIVNEDGTLTAVPEERYWAPIVPSIAVTWSF